jgi:hypothetical protein
MEDTAVYMTAPDTNGTPALPKRAGVRGMLPSTWITTIVGPTPEESGEGAA